MVLGLREKMRSTGNLESSFIVVNLNDYMYKDRFLLLLDRSVR